MNTKKKITKRARKSKSPQKILVLRTCDAKLQGHEGFQWPESGLVVAPDWNPDPKINCGEGLHGLAWGDGNWSLLSRDTDAKWLVVEVDAADLVPSCGGDKDRFRAGTVIYCGAEVGAVARVMCCPENFERIQSLAKGKSSSSGDYSTAASSGYNSKAASSGDYSTAASSGDYSMAASSGDYSKAASSGYGSTAASSGYYSKAASSGYNSKAASSGDYSKAAISGDYSMAASSGDYSKAASSGYCGIAASIGHNGTVRAGKNGLLIACWWDDAAKRYHACTGEVGVDGIKADTDYRVVDGKLAEAAS